MLNILINAYAVAPNWGSEQGVGWNWIVNIARYCKCYVITEGEWRMEIESTLEELPQKENIIFYYNPVSDEVRKMCWNQGDYRFYYHYEQWQKKTLEIARQICKEHRIDVIHQLNMVGFREPGFLWKIKDVPYVWGPLSGCSTTNLNFFSDAGIKTRLKYQFKNIVNNLQLRFSGKVRNAFKNAKVLITPRIDVHHKIKRIYHKETLIMPETGIMGSCVPIESIQRSCNDGLNILWVGRFIYTKKLDIALKTIAELKHLPKLKLHIVGFGLNNEEKHYKDLAKKLGIENLCVWHGKKDNKDVMEMMKKMDLFFFTSISEVTSTVILEAIQNRLPILCHNACGFGNVVTDDIGRKVDLVTPELSIKHFAEHIGYFYNNKHILASMHTNFDEIANGLTYESKGEVMYNIYKEITRKR